MKGTDLLDHYTSQINKVTRALNIKALGRKSHRGYIDASVASFKVRLNLLQHEDDGVRLA